MTPVPFWLMIVSIAIAVLPVPRSPMISSRWPRPIGIIESIALMPVCSGSLTGWRTMMPGASLSTLRECLALIGPSLVDRAAERVDDAADELRSDRHLEHASGAADLVAFLELQIVAEDDGADVVLFEVEREGRDRLARLRRRDVEHLAGHRLREAVDARDTVLYLEDGSDFLDLEVAEVGGFDLAKENVLDFAGAKCGFSGHDSLRMCMLGELVKFITSLRFPATRLLVRPCENRSIRSTVLSPGREAGRVLAMR